MLGRVKWPFPRRRSSAADPADTPVVGVVVPAYGVEDFIGATLDSLLAQTYTHWRAVVVDDGSPDRSGEIADAYAARDPRITVLHTPNGGLGAARNRGTAVVEGDFLAFVDSDDVLPPDALARQMATLTASGSDFVVGTLLRVEAEPPVGKGAFVPPWMKRLHTPSRHGIRIGDHPEMLGDVFAMNKLFRRSFWDAHGLAWAEGVRYEDQPTSTRAYLAGRFDVVDDVVYHWLVRDDGTSITQQRGTVTDLVDRWATKKMTLESVTAHGDPRVLDMFTDRVLPGDLWRYFDAIPGCDDAWWDEFRRGIDDIWGDRSLLDVPGLLPAQRVVGWLVQADRRTDAEAVTRWLTATPGRVPRTPDGRSLAFPADVLGPVPPHVLALRPGES